MKHAFLDLCNLCAEHKLAIRDDSRKVQPGDIFVAIPGAEQDGARYVQDAIARGAAWIVANSESGSFAGSSSCNYICHDDPREAVWRLASSRWRTRELPAKIIGVTGTNGKTTSTWLLEHLYRASGHNPGVIGTVNYRWNDKSIPAPLTTPGPLQLHELLYQMVEDGVDVILMEVSSHALAQNRVGGINFSGALFTNLTQDHLDYHQDMDDYFLAKATLFTSCPAPDKACCINFDDPWGKKLINLVSDSLGWGLEQENIPENYLSGRILASSASGLALQMSFNGKTWRISSPLVGAFNAHNLLGCQAMALAMGLEPEDMASLESFAGVTGRLERISSKDGLNVFVDYAHTPDALANVLQALRQAGFKRLITVFGCGGNRDRKKRPLMAEAVAQYSDVAILSSDNPRFEDPLAIINDALPGLADALETHVQPDRRKATELGIRLLEKGDALLIAGKGHEDYQIINGVKHHYSDQEVARELLACK